MTAHNEFLDKMSSNMETSIKSDIHSLCYRLQMVQRSIFSLVRTNRFIYIPSRCFENQDTALSKSIITAHASSVRLWTDIKRIIDRVHRHVCDHFDFGDMKTIPERINYGKLMSQNTWEMLLLTVADAVIHFCLNPLERSRSNLSIDRLMTWSALITCFLVSTVC